MNINIKILIFCISICSVLGVVAWIGDSFQAAFPWFFLALLLGLAVISIYIKRTKAIKAKAKKNYNQDAKQEEIIHFNPREVE